MCLETGEPFIWSLDQVLEEINRDRSSSWTPYTADDWLDGWKHWVEGVTFSLDGFDLRACP